MEVKLRAIELQVREVSGRKKDRRLTLGRGSKKG